MLTETITCISLSTTMHFIDFTRLLFTAHHVRNFVLSVIYGAPQTLLLQQFNPCIPFSFNHKMSFRMDLLWISIVICLLFRFVTAASYNPLITNGTCYYKAGEEMAEEYSPCGNAALSHCWCCQLGDACASENACYNFGSKCVSPVIHPAKH